ncbi:MAG: FAD:protein FMN transferase [Bdellovibrionota bacterium]
MNLVHVRLDQNHMATTFEFCVSCSAEDAAHADLALSEAHLLVTRLETELSEFLSESPVYQLNRAAPGVEISMPESVIELLEHSQRLQRLSLGSFNATAKSSKPDGSELKGLPRVSFSRERQTAWRNDGGARLGFGAIGKGYALDRTRKVIEQAGFTNYLLSAGGSSLLLSGFAAPGRPWKWGWSWSSDQQDGNCLGIPFIHASGTPIAIGVSGTHEKGEHLIDARSGETVRQANAPARSALVAHRSATDADALSTALFVAGWEDARRFIASIPASAPALAAIDPDGTPRWNGIFQRYFGRAVIEGAARAVGLALALCIATAAAATSALAEDAAIDLSGGAPSFNNPYLTERNWAWAMLPLFALALVALHLRKNRRPNAMKPPKPRNVFGMLALPFALWALVEQQSHAVEIEAKNKAIVALLGTPKAFRKSVSVEGKETELFYSKNAQGKADHIAVIETGLYPPNCTHTWAVGINPASGAVTEVRVIEMGCPHAFPTRAGSFLDQFKGKGPADVAKLDSQIDMVAKATGSAKLATDAVKRSIIAVTKIKGQI